MCIRFAILKQTTEHLQLQQALAEANRQKQQAEALREQALKDTDEIVEELRRGFASFPFSACCMHPYSTPTFF